MVGSEFPIVMLCSFVDPDLRDQVPDRFRWMQTQRFIP